ncbi:MAG: hypothetical protein V2J65_08630 [Desulfobacteraceae bacterium]|nr:hypothetical protein [Desulfobacteraceae bacterium]
MAAAIGLVRGGQPFGPAIWHHLWLTNDYGNPQSALSRLCDIRCCGAHYQARARLVIADRVVYESIFVVT